MSLNFISILYLQHNNNGWHDNRAKQKPRSHILEDVTGGEPSRWKCYKRKLAIIGFSGGSCCCCCRSCRCCCCEKLRSLLWENGFYKEAFHLQLPPQTASTTRAPDNGRYLWRVSIERKLVLEMSASEQHLDWGDAAYSRWCQMSKDQSRRWHLQTSSDSKPRQPQLHLDDIFRSAPFPASLSFQIAVCLRTFHFLPLPSTSFLLLSHCLSVCLF